MKMERFVIFYEMSIQTISDKKISVNREIA